MDAPDKTIYDYIAAGFVALLSWFYLNLHLRQGRLEQNSQTKEHAARLEAKVDVISNSVNNMNVTLEVLKSKMNSMPKRKDD
jgi:hypothetical protein